MHIRLVVMYFPGRLLAARLAHTDDISMSQKEKMPFARKCRKILVKLALILKSIMQNDRRETSKRLRVLFV